MKNLSRLARKYPRSARITIVSAFLILNMLGFMIGEALFESGILIPVSSFLILLLVYLTAVCLYPERGHRNYIRQKSMDIILAASGFLMMVCMADQPGLISAFSPDANAVTGHGGILPHTSNSHPYQSIAAFSASMKDAGGRLLPKKERRKLLKTQIRNIKHADDTNGSNKALLIILSVLIAIGLLTLIGAAACSLSCSGSDGAALLVGLGGTALIIILLVVAIRAIKKKGKKLPAGTAPAQKPQET